MPHDQHLHDAHLAHARRHQTRLDRLYVLLRDAQAEGDADFAAVCERQIIRARDSIAEYRRVAALYAPALGNGDPGIEADPDRFDSLT